MNPTPQTNVVGVFGASWAGESAAEDLRRAPGKGTPRGLFAAKSHGHRQYGTALVDAVGPALLIGWSEVGPRMLL